MADSIHILHETYRQHAKLFFAVALGITRSRADAEDAIHTAFSKALAAKARPDNPRSYMIRAVRNSAYDLRARQRPTANEAVFESSTDPDYPADTLDFLLGHLDDADREIILLKLVQGFSFREIGELTERSANTIATRYRRALEQLCSITEKETLL